jgi:arginyl-tRNA synthetase
MSTIRGEVEKVVIKVFEKLELDVSFGNVVKSNRPDLCQFQCNGALAVAKAAKRNPREIATDVLAELMKSEIFEMLEIAGPGFINMSVSDDFLLNFVQSTSNSENLNCSTDKKDEKVIIDFGGPNVAKPMHVGHLRSAIIGDSLQRLFKFLGYSVISDNHLGDWGTQMGMLISELRRREPNLPYFDESISDNYPAEAPIAISDLELMYPEASKKCKADKELMAEAVVCTDQLQKGRPGFVALWKHFVNLSVETLKNDFGKLDVEFDHWLGESFYMDQMGKVVEKLKADNFAQESEGALVMHIVEESDKKEIPPVMLVKSGGGFLYATSDIATIDYRVKEFDADRIYYVVDKRQSLHFEQVFRAVRKSKIAKNDMILEHTGFGTVNGKDGKPYKTRDGGVMKLGDLIKMVIDKAEERMEEAGIAADESSEVKLDIAKKVGIAALKFADLMNQRTSDYVFDLDKFSRFEGKTGPYLLYTAVRVKSILRKANESGFKSGAISQIGDAERGLALELSRLDDVLVKAVEDAMPNYLCDYAYELSQEFNRFYRACHIMREESEELRGSWLSLAELTLKTQETVLGLLGIEIPERM